MDRLAFRLLNEYQRDFPLVPRPFAEIAGELRVSEAAVIRTFSGLLKDGKIGRIGAVFRPNTVGASALAALAVPPSDLARVAEIVSARPEVNHSYEREHRYNLWFVVAAADEARVACAIDRIESDSGLKALRLPLEEEFHIDLGFDLENGSVPRAAPLRVRSVKLAAAELRLVAALADGLPMTEEPYVRLGSEADLSEHRVIEIMRGWVEGGVVRRFGAVVRHRPLGFRANAMVVWDVPEDEVRDAGRRLARHAAVTLCYRRARQLPDWPYNLFCMVHGRERGAVRRAIEEVARAAGLEQRTREILFSRTCFTQRGARYAHG
ncbi:MAG: Lrp/AsnC family transcriptional regulator [Betaproteobacteria bacterium]|nr:Lrp/AsnC family transcriptional regulator [Betaproteobacteria bacterium]